MYIYIRIVILYAYISYLSIYILYRIYYISYIYYVGNIERFCNQNSCAATSSPLCGGGSATHLACSLGSHLLTKKTRSCQRYETCHPRM